MQVHLVDGTFELFRHFFAVPSSKDINGQEVAAVRGVLSSVISMLEKGATHIGVATDHVIESFRNDLYPNYKTGEGIIPELYSQFGILEEGLELMGVKTWAMVEFEADDALASAAVKAASIPNVTRVFICTPDKDLSQCVSGDRVIQLDRMRNTTRNEEGVVTKFGVGPKSIADFLALVGDSADGYPGLKGWGAKAAASVLSKYPHLEDIPKLAHHWDPSIRSAKKLSATLNECWDEAILYRELARLRLDVDVFHDIEELLWKEPMPGFEDFCTRLRAPELAKRAASAKITRQSSSPA